ncbi:unnamed protein product [Arabis nemorensis]|uniref:Uncharacterized protein n=1 Tax=Arabis nemorensis TaxID=586526 RepID=A0A565CR05_9BRAS|nr:unnamed protein product [Arabis nemorensis]
MTNLLVLRKYERMLQLRRIQASTSHAKIVYKGNSREVLADVDNEADLNSTKLWASKKTQSDPTLGQHMGKAKQKWVVVEEEEAPNAQANPYVLRDQGVRVKAKRKPAPGKSSQT